MKAALWPTVRAAAAPVLMAGMAAEAPTAPDDNPASRRKRAPAISTSSAASAPGRSRRIRATRSSMREAGMAIALSRARSSAVERPEREVFTVVSLPE